MAESSTRSKETKTRLIEAAGQVFWERGFRSATVREICSRAGTPLGAINYHFRNKQGLYAAVIDHAMRSAMDKYPPHFGLGEGALPEERLRAFIHSLLSGVLDEGVPAWHMKLVVREIAEPTGALDNVMQSIRPAYRYLTEILREMLAEGDAAEGGESELVFLCAVSVIGQCLCHFTEKRILEVLHPKSFDPADIERIADHITRFSLGGIHNLVVGKKRTTRREVHPG